MRYAVIGLSAAGLAINAAFYVQWGYWWSGVAALVCWFCLLFNIAVVAGGAR